MANQFPIQRPYRVGAIIVSVFAIAAAFAVLSILLRLIWLSIFYRLFRKATRPKEYVFFHTHLGTYAACLLTACVLNTMSGLIGVHWVVRQAITDSWVCTLQAVFTQIGNWSTAFFTLSIAIHTFNSLVLRIRQSPFVCASTIILGWVISIIAALIPLAVHSQIYGPVAITCTFRTGFEKANFLLHVLPILIGSLLSVLLYSIVFLVLRGTLNIRGGVKLTLDPHQRWSKGSGDMENYQRFVARIAKSMLWFPIGYVACLLPYSVVQLLVISNFKVPLPVVICAFVFWNLLGIINVLLLYNTFRVLGPAFDAQSISRRAESSIFPLQRDYEETLSKLESPFRRPGFKHSRDSSYTSAQVVEGSSGESRVHKRSDNTSSWDKSEPMTQAGRPITPLIALNTPETLVRKASAQSIISSQLQYNAVGYQEPTAPPRSRINDSGPTSVSLPTRPPPLAAVPRVSFYESEIVDWRLEPPFSTQTSIVRGIRPTISAVAGQSSAPRLIPHPPLGSDMKHNYF